MGTFETSPTWERLQRLDRSRQLDVLRTSSQGSIERLRTVDDPRSLTFLEYHLHHEAQPTPEEIGFTSGELKEWMIRFGRHSIEQWRKDRYDSHDHLARYLASGYMTIDEITDDVAEQYLLREWLGENPIDVESGPSSPRSRDDYTYLYEGKEHLLPDTYRPRNGCQIRPAVPPESSF